MNGGVAVGTQEHVQLGLALLVLHGTERVETELHGRRERRKCHGVSRRAGVQGGVPLLGFMYF